MRPASRSRPRSPASRWPWATWTRWTPRSARGTRGPRPRRCSRRAWNSPWSSGARRASTRGPRTRRWRSRRSRSRWSTGSAPATGSAGRCATDCWPAGRWSGSSASPTPPARSSPPGWSARPRCLPRKKSKTSCGRRMPEMEPDFEALRELRARRPELIAARAAERRRRPLLGADGRLMIVAADHPARGSLGVRGVANAMANRYDLLRRLLVALSRPGVDGLLATADIIEDLLLLGALEDKVVFGSMNRGGLQGASFELDDRFTAYDAVGIAASHLDGGKMLCHVDFEDRATVATLESCAWAVNELSQRRTLAMIEPFVSHRVNGKVVNDLSAPAVVRSVAIASGL